MRDSLVVCEQFELFHGKRIGFQRHFEFVSGLNWRFGFAVYGSWYVLVFMLMGCLTHVERGLASSCFPICGVNKTNLSTL